MSMPITKAIIPTAGWGTRRLPITKAIEKNMLPIGNRPVIDYVVRDCIKAGIKEIFFVINQGSTQLQQYFAENERLNQFLEYNHKQDLLELAHPPHDVVFHYVEQDANGKYGTAVPVALVAPQLKKGESVAFVTGDAFFYNRDGSSEIARLIEATPAGGNAMLTTAVPAEEVDRYGVIDFNEDTGLFAGIVDRPPVGQAPSNQIDTAIDILNYDMITRISAFAQLEISGEYRITDPITQAVFDNVAFTVVQGQGEYLDCGNVHGWLHANDVIVNRH